MDFSSTVLFDTTLVSLLVIGGVLAAACVLWFFIGSSERHTLPVAYLIIAFLLETLLLEQPSVDVGLQIYINDVISLVVLLTMFVNFTRRPMPITSGPFILWMAFGALMLASFAQGFELYGKAAGTELRDNFYLWVAGLYCLTADFDEAEIRRMAKWAVWGAYALLAIALIRMLGVQFGLLPRRLVYTGSIDEFRPIGSHAAIYLAIVALVQLMAWLRGVGTRFSGFHALVLTIAVLLLQHRSVWISYCVGALFIFVIERRGIPRRAPWLIGFALMGGALVSIAGALGMLDTVAMRLEQSVLSMGDEGGTFYARMDGWVPLLDEWSEASVGSILAGLPYGFGYRRVIHGMVFDFGSHNFYIDLVLRTGVLGLIVFLLCLGMATLHSLSSRTESDFEHLLMRGLGIALIASMVYYVVYPAYYLHGVVIGLALAQIIRWRRIRETKVQEQLATWRAAMPRRVHPLTTELRR